MSTGTQLITAEQLLHMPKEERWRTELIEGVLAKMSPAGIQHGNISLTIAFPLKRPIDAERLGFVVAAETGFKVASDPDTVLAPGAAFIRQEELDRVGLTKNFWPGAPDLAVEVMSPDDTVRQTDEKARQWLAFGARMVWTVNPSKRTVSQYRPGEDVRLFAEGDTLDGLEVVPGFRGGVSEIFS